MFRGEIFTERTPPVPWDYHVHVAGHEAEELAAANESKHGWTHL
jgi:hypothetical protein